MGKTEVTQQSQSEERKSEGGSTGEHAGGAGLAQLQATLRPSTPPADVANLIIAHPADRASIVAYLQKTAGNGYTSQVLAAMPTAGARFATREIEAASKHDLEQRMVAEGVGAQLSPTSAPAVPADAATRTVASNAKVLQAATALADTAQNYQTALNSKLLPSYLKARDALDTRAVVDLGYSIITTLDVAHASIEALDDEIKPFRAHSDVGADVATDELAQAQQLDVLRTRKQLVGGLMPTIDLAVVTALTPTVFRGVAVTGEAVAPIAKSGALRDQVSDELVRTLSVLGLVAELEKQFSAPGAFADESKRGVARMQIGSFRHRPINLAFLRSALSSVGLWQHLATAESQPSPTAPSVLGAEASGVSALDATMADTKKQAKQTGWLTDTGHFDFELVRSEIQLGSSESIFDVYETIMTAPADGRAALLHQLQQAHLFDPFLSKLPWKFTKELHDGLPQGYGELKTALQSYFLVEGKYGKRLEEPEYHAPSLTKTIRDGGKQLGSVGETVVDALDDVYNILTLGFHHSYGDAHDKHAEGEITDEQYSTALKQITARTTVGMAIMMATAGLGRAAPAVMSGGGGAGVAGATTSAAVEGATFAGTEVAALDATDLATGAKREPASLKDYLKAAALGGVMGAAIGGATSALTGRTAAKYLPTEAQTRGQRLAAENPELASVFDQLGGAGRGATVDIRVRADQIDLLAERGMLDVESADRLRAAIATGTDASASVRIRQELNRPGVIDDGPVIDVGDAHSRPASKSVHAKHGDGESDEVVRDLGQPGGKQDVWSPEKRKQLVKSSALNLRRDGQRLLKGNDESLAIGKKLMSEGDGHAILDCLAAGDASALNDLGVKDVPEGFDTTLHEFALVEARDAYVVVMGGHTKVNIPKGTRVVGHTHPRSAELTADGVTKHVDFALQTSRRAPRCSGHLRTDRRESEDQQRRQLRSPAISSRHRRRGRWRRPDASHAVRSRRWWAHHESRSGRRTPRECPDVGHPSPQKRGRWSNEDVRSPTEGARRKRHSVDRKGLGPATSNTMLEFDRLFFKPPPEIGNLAGGEP